METRLPRATREEVSDSDRRSPWAHKTLLTLDGGGIKGYSSLLILKRLMYLIGLVERGHVTAFKEGDPRIEADEDLFNPRSRIYHIACDSSDAYPWNPVVENRSSDGTAAIDLKTQADLAADVQRTFQKDDRGHASASARTARIGPTLTWHDDTSSHYKPHHYFDYMAGTSTGGLSTIMLGRMELDVDAALACYDIVGNDVFGKPRLLPKHIPAVSLVGPKYASKRMERSIQKVISTGLVEEMREWNRGAEAVPFEGDAKRCRIIAVAQGRNLSSQARVWTPYLFRSYPHPHPSPYALQPTAQRRHCNPGPAHRTPIHVVARATSAAPTYFAEIEAENHVFKDGGLGNNNPTKMAWDEMQQLHGRAPRVLLSVGTGSAGSGGAEDQRARGHKGPLKNLLGNLDLLELLSNIATETEKVHEWIEEMAAGLSSNASSEAGKTKYYRANVERGVGDKVALDEWVPKEDGSKTKAKIEKATTAYLEKRDVHEMLLDCARELVWVRRRRARTDRWEEFACRVAYYCPEHSMAPMNASWYGGGHGVTCVQGRTFETRDELRRHALEAHSFVHRVPVRVHGSDVLDENPQFMHACYWDHCLLDVAVFQELEAYKTHLRDAHGIENLKFESREELEQWLDRGRMSLKDAFERRESQHARAESRVQQQDGLGEGDRQGEVNVEDREDSLRYNSGSSHSRKPSSSFGAASSTGK